MAFDVEAAKADGYTDEEIQQYLATKDQPLPPEQPRDRSEEQLGTAQSAAFGLAPYAIPAAGAAAAAVGGSKLYNAWNASAEAAKALADAKLASEQGIAQRHAQRMGGVPAEAPTSAARSMPGYGATTYNVPTAGAPTTGAAMTPAAPEAPPSASNYMQRMTQLAERYMPAAKSAVGAAGRVIEPVARVLGSTPVMGAQLMTYSPGLNANEEEELRRRRAMQPTFNFPQQ